MRRVNLLNIISIFFISLLLCSCAGLGDDNTIPPTPLSNFRFQFQPLELWSLRTGGDMGHDFLRLGPVIHRGQVYVTNKKGLITAVNLHSGKSVWQAKMKQRISSAPAVGNGRVIFASMKPELIALDAQTGDLLWRKNLPNQVVASPAIDCGRVVVKTIDGKVLAYQTSNGTLLWSYDHGSPTLILRPSSAPKIFSDKVLVGFSDGMLSALNLNDGSLLWERTIAFPTGITETDQLVDIAANSLISDQTVYVVTYQGKLSALSLNTGKVKWRRSFSSYAGMALGKYLYVSESDGSLWAFVPYTGAVVWHNRLLLDRGITGPAVMGNNIVVGDQSGYLHWFTQNKGEPLAYVLVHDDASIASAPKVAFPYVCVLTQQGGLSAWIQAAATL